MSVKQVQCPKCKQTQNVMASMMNAKCPSCGMVFSTTAEPAAAGGDPANASNPYLSTASQASPASSANKAIVPAVVVGVVLLVAFGGISFLFLGSSSTTTSTVPAASSGSGPVTDSGGASNSTAKADNKPLGPDLPTEYQVISLPETTRKQIHRDYRAIIDSSLGKSSRIPDGAAGIALNNTLDSVVRREVDRLAALHSVSSDDIYHIVAEGDDKGW